MSTPIDDDAPAFADDPTEGATPRPEGLGPSDAACWTVLAVDDDASVHQVTRLALRGMRFEGRPVELVHAYSADEARALLTARPGCALVLLDVVMETDAAGLELVEWIRGTLRETSLRIVLRTGQPGLAPEESVMERYDIHDYHAKTDLSARRLRTSVIGGLRAYRDLRALLLQRQGLEKVIAATGALFAPRNLEQLLSGILEQVAALLVPREHAIFFLARPPLFREREGDPEAGTPAMVLAASGRFSERAGARLDAVLGNEGADAVEGAIRPGTWTFIGAHGLFGFDIGEPALPALFLEDATSLSDWERQTVALFCTSAAMALRNQRLYLEREDLLSSFERFVPNEFITLLEREDIRRLQLGDHRVRDLAVCFLDVEGFTGRSEALGPAGVFALLNRIFGAIGPVATAHGGIIDKYMGDGVMVLFPGGPDDAVRTAVGIQTAIHALNRSPDLRDAPVVVRATVEYGPVILGTVGHEGRFDTTVISDVANVAARLQGWCRTLDVSVLVTDRCATALEGRHARPVGDLAIRGRNGSVAAWEVYDTDPAAVRDAKDATAPALTTAVALLREGRTGEAAAILGSLHREHPGDGAVRWMLAERARHADA
jgi:class 3 adenylate cyclase/CheY-like chemotaxis protein